MFKFGGKECNEKDVDASAPNGTLVNPMYLKDFTELAKYSARDHFQYGLLLSTIQSYLPLVEGIHKFEQGWVH